MNRIFIKNLPVGATESDLTAIFTKYGSIKSTEIKERRNIKSNEESPFFAYINLETDQQTLQKCFQHFSNNLFHGEMVELQIAKESFLDRLKRERENTKSEPVPQITHQESNGVKLVKKTAKKEIVEETSSESSSDSDEDFTVTPEEKQTPTEPVDIAEDDLEGLIIKNNKFKTIDMNGLKIESFGKEPVMIINKQTKKINTSTESEKRRLESLENMRKGYQQQKLTIKAALTRIDKQPPVERRKLTENNSNNKTKPKLFEEDQSDDEGFNFEMKSQFEGQKGSQLMELQSKYKNDSRFKLDERFIEDNNREEEHAQEEPDSLEVEKQREVEILNAILGKASKPKPMKNEPERHKRMLRFDPTEPEHSRFELKKPQNQPETKKRKHKENEEEIQQPEVSQEVFYKVETDLKQSLEEKQGFSLLEAFGKVQEHHEEQQEQPKELTKIKKTQFDTNPFHYDSSDNESEEETTKKEPPKEPVTKLKLWQEPFFFKKDDYRLEEGRDFMLRIGTTDNPHFNQLRRELKQITRTKVKHVQRLNRPFKKKLGGASTRKKLRFKRALKR